MDTTDEAPQSATIEDLVGLVEHARIQQESAENGSSSEETLQRLESALLTIERISSAIRGGVTSRLEAVKEERTLCDAFGCNPGQIAHSQEEITADTMAYIGPLAADVFEQLYQNEIKHIYNTSYAPENQVRIGSLETGGVRAGEIEKTALVGIDVSDFTQNMLRNEKEFIEPVNNRYDECEGAKETCDFACLTLRDLGFTENPTSRQLFEEQQLSQRAAALGFELCFPEDVAALANAEGHDTLGEYYSMAMQPIPGSDGRLGVFGLGRGDDGLWHRGWADPDDRWALGARFVVRRPRKSDA